MNKSSCNYFEAAMERPYKRNGIKAKFDTINRCWYYHSFRKMQLGPNIPSKDPIEFDRSIHSSKDMKIRIKNA